LVSAFGNFVFKLGDKVGSRYIERYRKYSEKRKFAELAKETRLTGRLIKSPSALTRYQIRTETLPIKAIIYLIMGILLIMSHVVV